MTKHRSLNTGIWLHVFVALLALALLLPFALAAAPRHAWADDATQDTTGSITLQMKGYYNGAESTMKGGQIALYRVASVRRSSDGASFDVSGGQFASSETVADVPLMGKQELDEQNANISEALVREIEANGIKPLQTANITDGEARFPEVEEGLYLLVQTKLSEGGRKMNSFLLSVPDEEGQLNIVGKPKPGEWSGGESAGEDEPGKKSDESDGIVIPPFTDASSRLPQPSTGELVVMFLPLAILGFALVWAGVRSNRRNDGAA